MGGRNVSRLEIWRANVTEEPGIQRRGYSDARAGDWRERGALFGGQRRAAQSAALSAARATCRAQPAPAEYRRGFYLVPEFSGLAKGESELLCDGRFALVQFRSGWRGRSRARQRAAVHSESLLRARSQARVGARLRAGRR